MGPVRIVLLACVLAGLSLRQQRVWLSDVALWEQAAFRNMTDARPAFNYGMALRKAGDVSGSVHWFLEASHRAQRTPQEEHYRRRVAEQLAAVELAGYPVCDLASVRPFCSS